MNKGETISRKARQARQGGKFNIQYSVLSAACPDSFPDFLISFPSVKSGASSLTFPLPIPDCTVAPPQRTGCPSRNLICVH